ncbi:hypothetical protein L1987_62884 [Smallanthus sonchifolius]|uniref:Uncharacterized protein n=1 Tax=Smallanthus sonchifolius TaxID=185202 RepID=A0ACB9CBR7_9ASTR|nr:hypothetical protein L1987_62884 [Smallanthus sonchifolius]
MTEKGWFGEDNDIEDGLIGEHTEGSELQQAGETGAKVCEGEKEKKNGKDLGGLEDMEASSFSVGVTQKIYANKDKHYEMHLDVHETFEQTETSKDAIVTEREQGKVVGGLEDLEALNVSFGFTKETDSAKGCEKKQNEIVADVYQAPKQTETSKGVEEEEYEMPADVDHESGKGVEEEEYDMSVDVDHESVNQDLETDKDNLIEEMELKTSSENINCQRLTGRTKVASEALRSPYLVREVDINKSMTK